MMLATLGANSFIDFYSINETKKLTIQGRALPFDDTDVVPLGYKSTIDSDFTIAIDHADGFFDKQEVYLEDKITGKIINLRNENYTFSTLAGTFADRFVLRYTNKTLGTGDFENIEDSVLISVKNKVVSITSSKETIKDVNIFNVGAQLMYSKNKVNSSELQINNLHSSDQVLLVKVTLENGSTVSKKVVFSNLP
ncbi:T9SS sorting signal type C domain-containing protein [Flavobacterium ginsengisoli]|uniref:T9SS sorting signal type C domain-containing protein n=1 Tax=Flavobacterium ginsengisoli TaxID=871694 RepID=UPI002415556E|nr:T9SS sorting signal type C domain-containing protein [Flavobacterium ginsengisoli]